MFRSEDRTEIIKDIAKANVTDREQEERNRKEATRIRATEEYQRTTHSVLVPRPSNHEETPSNRFWSEYHESHCSEPCKDDGVGRAFAKMLAGNWARYLGH